MLHEASSKVPAFVGDILVGRDKRRPKSELTHAVAGGQEHSAEEGRGAVGGCVLVLTHTREPTPASDPGLRTAPPLTTPDPGRQDPLALGLGSSPKSRRRGHFKAVTCRGWREGARPCAEGARCPQRFKTVLKPTEGPGTFHDTDSNDAPANAAAPWLV